MTSANPLDPPKLATWLLEQFSPVLKNAPLAGDLVEEFKEGRSTRWYWRQVFWAIVIGLLNLFRKQCGSVAYAVVCSGFTTVVWSSIFHVSTKVFVRSVVFVDGGIRLYWDRTVQASTLPEVYALYAKSYGMPWPWSLVYQIAFYTVFQTVIVAFALVAYVGLARIVKAQNLLGAFIAVAVVLAIGNVAAPFLSVPLNVDILTLVRLPQLAECLLITTPTIVALLIGMWKAKVTDDVLRPASV